MERGVRSRRVRWDRRSELRRKDVLEITLGRDEVDDDRAGWVVDHDSANPTLLPLREPFRSDDVPEETGTGRVEQEVTLDRLLEVACLDAVAVRVAQSLPQGEAVRPVVPRDLGERCREVGNELRAARSADVFVAEERKVDVPHHAPALGRVRKARIEIVGRLVHRDPEVRELVRRLGTRGARGRRGRRRRGRGLRAARRRMPRPTARCGEGDDERERRSDRDCPPPKGGQLHASGEI